jgi:hypothetical protein
MNDDRLSILKNLLQRKKRDGNQLCWIRYNPKAEYGYEISNAEEDIEWMVYEIERLRNENAAFREFIGELKRQIEQDLGSRST